MSALHACIEGIGVLGPGLPDWPVAARVLEGASRPTARLSRTTVFTSSGGDGQNCHEICEVLATPERQLSPTRFHNSVHNAPAGYWGIATGATAAANSLCAYDASFGAGLLEALCQLAVEHTAVLLIAYDASYPEPMRSVRPIPDAFGVALLLAPGASCRSLAGLELTLTEAPADRMADPALERLRTSIPAARSLPLLAQLARGVPAAAAAAGPAPPEHPCAAPRAAAPRAARRARRSGRR